MRDIILSESVHLDKANGIHLVTFCSEQPKIQSYALELFNCELFEYSKCYDGDLITIHFSPEELDKLCTAYLNYKSNMAKVPG